MSPRVGPSGPLSRDRIVEAAIELADEGGLDLVTMSRVARRLNAGAMSLYRHVANKDDLVSAMVERITADFSYPARDGRDWRDCMHALANQDRASFHAHPWMLTATATVPPPASLAAMEWALEVLEGAGFSSTEAARGIMAINHYVQGSARARLGLYPDIAEDDQGRAWQQRLGDTDLSSFPRLQHLIAVAASAGERDSFADGLDLILDGMQH